MNPSSRHSSFFKLLLSPSTLISLISLALSAFIAIQQGYLIGGPEVIYQVPWQHQFGAKALTVVQVRNMGWIGSGSVELLVLMPGTTIESIIDGQDVVTATKFDAPSGGKRISMPGIPSQSTRTFLIESPVLIYPQLSGTFQSNIGVRNLAPKDQDGASLYRLAFVLLPLFLGWFVITRYCVRAVFILHKK